MTMKQEIGFLKKDKIEMDRELIWDVQVKQELNEDVLHCTDVKNDLNIEVSNNLSSIKQEVHGLNTNIIFEKCRTSVKTVCNFSDDIKCFRQKRIKQINARGTSLNGPNQTEPFTRITNCNVCGNTYTKHNELTCFSSNDCLKRKKLLLNTNIYDKEINNSKSNLIYKTNSTDLMEYVKDEIVEVELKEEFRETSNHSDKILTNECYCSSPFKCDICLQSFLVKTDTNTHLHSNKDTNTFKCEICLKSYSSKNNVTTHVCSHADQKPRTYETAHKCVICLKSFSKKCNLNMHLLIRRGETAFRCVICLKSFSEKCNLNKHLLTHTGEKAFKCVICSKSFTQKCHLDRHLRTHTDEKPFKCETCLRSFACENNLNIHSRSHTGDNPFKCKLCLKSFPRKYSLSRHLRSHTDEIV